MERGPRAVRVRQPVRPVHLERQALRDPAGQQFVHLPRRGLGAIAVRATRVTDAMFMAAARTLASTVTEADLAQGSLYPPLSDVRSVSARIAAAVAEVAYDRGPGAGRAPGRPARLRAEPHVRPALPDLLVTAVPPARRRRRPPAPARPVPAAARGRSAGRTRLSGRAAGATAPSVDVRQRVSAARYGRYVPTPIEGPRRHAATPLAATPGHPNRDRPPPMPVKHATSRRRPPRNAGGAASPRRG